MSIPGVSLALSALEAGGIALLQQLHGRTPRGMQWNPVDPVTGLPITQDTTGQPIVNNLVAQVTVEEDHEDEMYITEHPVEQGPPISDHAYKLPVKLRLTLGWSNSPSPSNTGLLFVPGNILAGIAATANAFSSSPSFVLTTYAKLIALQNSAVPITIFTGKRKYSNMLLRRVRTRTTKETENSLIVQCEAQQIIVAVTQLVAAPSQSVQRNPQKTAPTTNNGSVQALPKSDLSSTQMNNLDPGWSSNVIGPSTL